MFLVMPAVPCVGGLTGGLLLRVLLGVALWVVLRFWLVWLYLIVLFSAHVFVCLAMLLCFGAFGCFRRCCLCSCLWFGGCLY